MNTDLGEVHNGSETLFPSARRGPHEHDPPGLAPLPPAIDTVLGEEPQSSARWVCRGRSHSEHTPSSLVHLQAARLLLCPTTALAAAKAQWRLLGTERMDVGPASGFRSREFRSLWVSTELLSGSSPEPYVRWPPSASHLCRISRFIPRSGRGERYLLGPFSVHRQTTLEDRLGLAKLELGRTTSNQ